MRFAAATLEETYIAPCSIPSFPWEAYIQIMWFCQMNAFAFVRTRREYKSYASEISTMSQA